jgi:hypothetical protein
VSRRRSSTRWYPSPPQARVAAYAHTNRRLANLRAREDPGWTNLTKQDRWHLLIAAMTARQRRRFLRKQRSQSARCGSRDCQFVHDHSQFTWPTPIAT